eukprot:CAMPEP_0206469716 /NCGR_PEP_ID=MMETSP0324_2-20121206/30460_1 /ASSEMBLY_ACC=CAM_ASM_000836 /TAXON_ID=2866 /ORGANISM="Crypthecodinium cohnii, Strain Seligo" /LENGTH=32 /DNA_ID= /DNA_START= /DNA_END= /DNA_ORIENTATION=
MSECFGNAMKLRGSFSNRVEEVVVVVVAVATG